MVEPTYVIDLSVVPRTCFPAGLNTADLIDMSRVGDTWGRFFDLKNDKIHDCEEYYQRMLKERADED